VKKSTKNEEILAVNIRNIRSYLKTDFWPIKGHTNLDGIIISTSVYKERADIENNNKYKQIIPYCIIVEQFSEKVYLYERSVTKVYNEERLRGRFSIGLGGHVREKWLNGVNPVIAAMRRELLEEVGLRGFDWIYAGFVNNEDDEVGQVHLGCVFIIEPDKTGMTEINPDKKEVVSGGFKSISEIRAPDVYDQLERWSQILVDNWDSVIK